MKVDLVLSFPETKPVIFRFEMVEDILRYEVIPTVDNLIKPIEDEVNRLYEAVEIGFQYKVFINPNEDPDDELRFLNQRSQSFERSETQICKDPHNYDLTETKMIKDIKDALLMSNTIKHESLSEVDPFQALNELREAQNKIRIESENNFRFN